VCIDKEMDLMVIYKIPQYIEPQILEADSEALGHDVTTTAVEETWSSA